MFLSHHPGGSGALPFLEAFNVKFRDGYANNPKSLGYNCGPCSQFIMTPKNGKINQEHAIFKNSPPESIRDTVKYLGGVAVFRKPNIQSYQCQKELKIHGRRSCLQRTDVSSTFKESIIRQAYGF